MPSDNAWVALINGLAGNPALLLLCVVLLAGGWVAYKFGMKLMDNVLSRVDKLDERLGEIKDKLGEIVELKKDVGHIEERIERIEEDCRRRHP